MILELIGFLVMAAIIVGVLAFLYNKHAAIVDVPLVTDEVVKSDLAKDFKVIDVDADGSVLAVRKVTTPVNEHGNGGVAAIETLAEKDGLTSRLDLTGFITEAHRDAAFDKYAEVKN